MITFVQLGSLGRLGNQLFQYAALRGLGLMNGYETKIPNPDNKEWHGQRCLLNNFNIQSKYLNANDLNKLRYTYDEVDHMTNDKCFYNIRDYTNINGFFQSTFYFGKFKEEIKAELTPKKIFLEEARESIYKLKSKYQGYEIVSIHLRRGDNTDNTDPNQVELNRLYGIPQSKFKKKNSMYFTYLEKAKNKFQNKKIKFMIFTGGKRWDENNKDDLKWCKDNFLGEEYIFSDAESPMQDFSLIMFCDHNILSPASTFGWWAAYLNKNETKKVIAPNNYHPDVANFNYRQGFYPKEWIII